jgi:hypothetical protein
MRTPLCFAFLLGAGLLAGCSSSSNPVPTDGAVPDKPACSGAACGDGSAEAVIHPDAAKPDHMILPSALQAVMNSMTLPASGTDYACDFDGTGTKNQLGAIMGLVTGLNLQGFDFQSTIDSLIRGGSFLMLLDVQAKAITDDPSMQVAAFLGEDRDIPPDPNDNFSGNEELAVRSDSPPDLILPGKIAASNMAVGPGTFVIPVPIAIGSGPGTVSIVKAHLEAKLSADPRTAMTGGRLCGAIPWTEVDATIIPGLAYGLDTLAKSPGTPQSTRDQLLNLLDTDKDGTISAQEIRDNGLLKMVIKPDVDTNNDKTPDAMSIGMAFTAVGCKISK